MKKQSRLTALLLALCMLMSTLPVSALADGIQTLEDYLSAVQRVQQELSESSIPVEEENAYTLTRTTTTETIVRETVTGELSGEGESAFTLPVAGKLELSTAAAADAYQWQIDVGGVWANIVGDTAAAVTLTYAKVQNALSGGTARVRCAMTQDGQTVYSAVAAVTVDETVKTQTVEGTEEISAVSYTSEAPRSLARTLNAGAATYANEPVYKYYIRVYYQFENGETAAQTYEAEVSQGSNFTLNLTFPTVTGYLPYIDDVQTDSINRTFENIQATQAITVIYKPTEVNYTVKHYQQNADDDEYALVLEETMKGLTASTVPDVAKTYEGFYALVYEKPAIAADGSTVVEVYYDRYYYLMSFNLDGGYGVEPIYARFGAPISVPTEDEEGKKLPIKAGYTFSGWSLDGTNTVDLPGTMPAENRTYKAVWTPDATAKVTIVFWGENADDEEYSYIKSAQVNVKPGTEFTYSEDGSLICELEEHQHDLEECYILTCTQVEHDHEAEKCELKCVHSHTLECYYSRYGLVKTDKPTQITNDTQDGIYTYETSNYIWTTTHYYLKIGDTWYCGQDYSWSYQEGWHYSNDDTKEITLANCTHVHGDSCYTCGKIEHSHTLADCYKLVCKKEVHTHTSDCYMSGAGLDGKLWKFVKSDTVTVAADGSSVVNVYYDRVEYSVQFYTRDGQPKEYTDLKITAKWGANILDKWPSRNGSSSWYVNTSDNKWQNSIQVMPVGGAKFYGPKTGDENAIAYYYVEVLPGEEGTEHNNVKYKLHHTDTSVSSGNVTSEDKYEIQGFTYKEGTSNGKSYNGAKFYYTRNRYDLVMNNGEINQYVFTSNEDSNYYAGRTGEGVYYEAELSSYKKYIPTAPSFYEPGSVTFGGWYLNPECTGAEYKLDKHTMPADNVLLYAKWVPVTHTVEFYLDEAALNANTKLSTHKDIEVPHGSFADPTPATPSNGGYTFVGWFYKENGLEKAFDFANMPVTKDMKVYGKWSSNTLMPVIVYFKYMDEDGVEHDIAAPVEANPLAGTTVTFDAKGGTDLYAGYQEGYFPMTKSHSMLVDINTPENAGTTEDGVEWIAIEKDGKTQIVQSYTFWYKKVDAVPYRVHYVTDDPDATGDPIEIDGKTYTKVATTKNVDENTKAVVTEVFEPVSGYMPDAYQKRLVLSVTDEGKPDTANNVIVFYYTKDTEHAYYSIKHYREIIDNNGNTVWEEYASSQPIGEIGKECKSEPINIDDYWFDPTVPGTKTVGVLTADTPLELKFYYRRDRASLTVTKGITGVVEPDASFVFQITGYGGLDLKVVIKGTGSVTIDNLIAKETYTVKEISSNWRYQCSESMKTCTLVKFPEQNVVTITNTHTEDKWLDSNAYSENVFDAVKTGNTENGNEGGEQS